MKNLFLIGFLIIQIINTYSQTYSVEYIRSETTKYLERCKGSMLYLYGDKTPSMCKNSPYWGKKKIYEPEMIDETTYSGKMIRYFEGTNNICTISYYSTGKETKDILFHPDGTIYSIIKYQYGKKEGEVTFVDRKGKIILIGNYENDDPVGNWYTPTWWDNGFPITSSYARNQFPGAIDEMVQIIQFYKNSHYRFIGNLDIQNCE